MVRFILALCLLLLGVSNAEAGLSYKRSLAIDSPHTYYLSETGNDRNSGTDPTAPWQTFLFAGTHMTGNSTLILVDCGDYPTNGASGQVNQFHNIASNNLGDRGYLKISGNPACGSYPSITGISGNSPISPTTQSNFTEYNHLALVCITAANCNCSNDVFVNNHLRFTDLQVGPCHGGGISISGGDDYIYIAHVIAHDTSDTSPFHGSGISLGFMVASDSLPAPHNYILDVISYNNKETSGGTHTDGNGIIIDDLFGDQQSQPEYTGGVLVDGAIVFNNGGRGFEIFDSSFVVARHISSYGNGQDSSMTGVNYGCGSSTFPSINLERTHDNQFYDMACQETVATVPPIKLFGRTQFAQSSINFNSTDGTLASVTAAQNNVLGSNFIPNSNPIFTNPTSPGTTFASIKAAFTLLAGSPGLGTGTEYGFYGVPAVFSSSWTENPSSYSSNMGR